MRPSGGMSTESMFLLIVESRVLINYARVFVTEHVSDDDEKPSWSDYTCGEMREAACRLRALCE